MSDTEYTPTAEQIRSVIAWRHKISKDRLTPESFDRFLSEVKAQAVHEAAQALRHHATPQSELASPNSDALWFATHNREVERATVKKSLEAVSRQRPGHIGWSEYKRGRDAAVLDALAAIRSTFGLAPDEKGGE